MFTRVLQFAVGTALAFVGASAVFALQVAPPDGFVNDRAEMLSPGYRAQLEEELKAYEVGTGNEIAVLTVPSLEGDAIENVAVEVFEQWGIGKKGEDNGLLLLIARDDRKIRIEVGYGLEGYITDGRAGEIIRRDTEPAFKAGEYDAGVASAVLSILDFLGGQPAPADEEFVNSSSAEWGVDALINLVFFLLFFVFRVVTGFMVVMASSPSIWLGGALGLFFGGIVGAIAGQGALSFVGIFAGAFAVVGLLLDLFLSTHYKHLKASGKPDPWWFSGGHFGSGGGSSSSGFGGFGGGRSGGGGASGGW